MLPQQARVLSQLCSPLRQARVVCPLKASESGLTRPVLTCLIANTRIVQKMKELQCVLNEKAAQEILLDIISKRYMFGSNQQLHTKVQT